MKELRATKPVYLWKKWTVLFVVLAAGRLLSAGLELAGVRAVRVVLGRDLLPQVLLVLHHEPHHLPPLLLLLLSALGTWRLQRFWQHLCNTTKRQIRKPVLKGENLDIRLWGLDVRQNRMLFIWIITTLDSLNKNPELYSICTMLTPQMCMNIPVTFRIFIFGGNRAKCSWSHIWYAVIESCIRSEFKMSACLYKFTFTLRFCLDMHINNLSSCNSKFIVVYVIWNTRMYLLRRWDTVDGHIV